MPFAAFWLRLLNHYDNSFGYPNVLILVLIILMWMLDTSCCERGFAFMNRTHTPARNRLQVKRVNQIMGINLLGCSVNDFDPKVVLEKWMEGPLGKESERGRYLCAQIKRALREIGDR